MLVPLRMGISPLINPLHQREHPNLCVMFRNEQTVNTLLPLKNVYNIYNIVYHMDSSCLCVLYIMYLF